MELSDVYSLLRETTARFRIFWQSPPPLWRHQNWFFSNIKIRTFNESAVDLQSNKNCNDRRSTAVFALMFLYYYRLSLEWVTLKSLSPAGPWQWNFKFRNFFWFNPANFYCDFIIRGLFNIINFVVYRSVVGWRLDHGWSRNANNWGMVGPPTMARAPTMPQPCPKQFKVLISTVPNHIPTLSQLSPNLLEFLPKPRSGRLPNCRALTWSKVPCSTPTWSLKYSGVRWLELEGTVRYSNLILSCCY